MDTACSPRSWLLLDDSSPDAVVDRRRRPGLCREAARGAGPYLAASWRPRALSRGAPRDRRRPCERPRRILPRLRGSDRSRDCHGRHRACPRRSVAVLPRHRDVRSRFAHRLDRRGSGDRMSGGWHRWKGRAIRSDPGDPRSDHAPTGSSSPRQWMIRSSCDVPVLRGSARAYHLSYSADFPRGRSMPKRYWLMKGEPRRLHDRRLARDGRTSWEGVRNYQARNFMRDEMQEGDGVLFYASNADPLGVAGRCDDRPRRISGRVCVQERSQYYDEGSTKASPIWYMVDIGFEERFPEIVSLETLKSTGDSRTWWSPGRAVACPCNPSRRRSSRSSSDSAVGHGRKGSHESRMPPKPCSRRCIDDGLWRCWPGPRCRMHRAAAAHHPLRRRRRRRLSMKPRHTLRCGPWCNSSSQATWRGSSSASMTR